VPGGKSTGSVKRCSRSSPFHLPTTANPRFNRAMRSGWSVRTLSAPVCSTACASCAWLKKSGSGRCTVPARRAARSAITQAGPLPASTARTRVPAIRAARSSTADSSSAARQVCRVPCRTMASGERLASAANRHSLPACAGEVPPLMTADGSVRGPCGCARRQPPVAYRNSGPRCWRPRQAGLGQPERVPARGDRGG
jgi:hypothetical protein